MTDNAKPKALTKGQTRTKIAEATGLTAKQVGEVLDALNDTVASELQRVSAFTLHGLAKFTKVVKPAVAGGVEKPNPFKPGEKIITKDKPESKAVKVRPLKDIKDAIQ
jgi:nucleoid DNA-binding protein